MAKPRKLQFPDGFLWGTASSSYQCEGGNTNSQWYRWEQQGHILSGESCGIADNWWQDAESDFNLAEQMENNALRLSLEWSRIEPAEGQWDSAAIERYRVMLSELLRRHMTPIVTLHHFSEPLWFANRGGFANEENIVFFVRYAEYVVRALRELCDFWITFNEPNVYATQGYVLGSYPPGEQQIVRAFQVMRNMIQAHVQSFYVMRHLQPAGQIGYCLHYRLFDAANDLSLFDRGAAGLQETFFNWAILQVAETGRFSFPLNILLTPIKHAAGTRDYHGVNYYTRDTVKFDVRLPAEMFGRRFVPEGVVRNDPGLENNYGEIYPEGMYRMLRTIYQRTRGNKPFYITENGFNDALDSRRPRAILEHLAMIHRAINEGIPVRGYLHWSLVDNFEWNEGWSARFGLIELDLETMRRIPRASASMFGEICRANAITESIVERYAPEAAEIIFGFGDGIQRQVAIPG